MNFLAFIMATPIFNLINLLHFIYFSHFYDMLIIYVYLGFCEPLLFNKFRIIQIMLNSSRGGYKILIFNIHFCNIHKFLFLIYKLIHAI